VLEELLILIELSDLGDRIAERGLERWAIDCARRAVSANVDRCGPQLPALREGLATAKRWLEQPPTADQRNDANAAASTACKGILRRAQEASRYRLALQRTAKSAEAVARALDCVAEAANADQVAAVAREAFPDREDEAAAQARRLLFWTRLLPSGAELLVRLDYAESRGRLPIDGEQRAWIEAQRVLLMADDEAGRLAVVLRHLELVFLAELERIR
jgi:hypothetical protein